MTLVKTGNDFLKKCKCINVVNRLSFEEKKKPKLNCTLSHLKNDKLYSLIRVQINKSKNKSY